MENVATDGRGQGHGASRAVGMVQTVRGFVDPADLGPTLPHEHLFFEISEAMIRPQPDPALAALADAELLAAVAARGPYIQLDGWGWEGYISLDSWAPSDEYRFRLTRGLIALGLERQLLLSQDVCEKRQWRAFGGRGYGHVLTFVVPLLRHNGVSEAMIEQLLVGNPARMLTIAPPRDVEAG